MKNTFDIRDYGAEPGVLCTTAFQAAVDAADAVCGTVLIPAGLWVTGTVNVKGVSLYLDKGATLQGSSEIADYRYIDIVHAEMGQILPLLYSIGHENITFSGEGCIDLNGDHFFDFQKPEIPESRIPLSEEQLRECTVTKIVRPNQPIFFHKGKHIVIRDIRIKNAPSWTMTFDLCEDIRVLDMTIDNSLVIPNCDGMHFCCSSKIVVRGCNISAGDDCVALTCITDWDVPTEKVVISDCIFRCCSKAISVGYMHSIVRDVTISNCVVTQSNRALVVMSSPGTGLVENLCVNNMRLDTYIQAGNWWGNGEPVCVMGTTHDNPAYFVRPPANRFPVACRNLYFQNLVCSGENVLAVVGESGSVVNVHFDQVSFERKDSKNLPLKGRMVDIAPGEQTAIMPEDDIPTWLLVKESKHVSFTKAGLWPYHGIPLEALIENCEDVTIDAKHIE